MGGFGLVTAIKPRIFRRFAFLPPGRSKLAARGIPLSVPIGTPVAGQPAAALGWFAHSFASGWHSSGSEVSRPSRRAGGFARSRSSKRSGWSGCLPGRITTLLRISDVSDGCFHLAYPITRRPHHHPRARRRCSHTYPFRSVRRHRARNPIAAGFVLTQSRSHRSRATVSRKRPHPGRAHFCWQLRRHGAGGRVRRQYGGLRLRQPVKAEAGAVQQISRLHRQRSRKSRVAGLLHWFV
jgi:hypothetical protein